MNPIKKKKKIRSNLQVSPGLQNVKTFKLSSVIREVLTHIENYPLAHFWRLSIFSMVIMRYRDPTLN